MLPERLLEQVAAMRGHAPNVYAYGDAKELHKLRVAIRRLRALLRARVLPIDDPRLDSLRDRLRDLGRAIAPARDADVLAAHLHAQDGLGEDGLDQLLERVEAERRERYAAARAALDDASFVALLEDLDTFCADASLDEVDLDAIVKAEGKKLGRAIRGAETDDGLHEARIKAKRLRYAAEAAGDDKVAARAKRVQDFAGEHQDAVVAEAALRRLADPATAIVAGRLIERQAARRRHARRRLPKAWKKLRQAA